MRLPVSQPVAKFIASAAMAGTIGLSGGAAVMGQDATPVGTPIGPDMCVAPTTTAPVLATPASDVTMATPVADEVADSIVVEDEAVIAEVTAVIENRYACFNEGRGEAFVALFTEQGRMAAFGEIDPVDLAAQIEAMSTMVQAGEIEIIDVYDFGDGTLGVDYQVQVGQQIFHFVDALVNQNDAWLVDGREIAPPETDLDTATASVESTPTEDGVTVEVSPTPVMTQPAQRLMFINSGDTIHTLVVLQGGDAATITDLDLTNLPEGMTYVGGGVAGAGEISETMFVDLEPGTYVIAVETADGEVGAVDLMIEPPFDPTA